MNSQISFVLSQSGAPLEIPNGLVATSSIGVTYTINGGPTTLSISIVGVKNPNGECALLDSYAGTSNTSRTISLSDTYDYFLVTAVWTQGNNVSINASLTSTGPGPTFVASQSLPAVQNYPVS